MGKGNSSPSLRGFGYQFTVVCKLKWIIWLNTWRPSYFSLFSESELGGLIYATPNISRICLVFSSSLPLLQNK